jgi:hypothetical protein
LGFDTGEVEIASVPGAEVAYKDGKLTFIRALYGYDGQEPAAPYGDDINGTNVRYRQSVVPKLTFANGAQRRFILASQVYGKVGHDSLTQLMELVKDFVVEGDTVTVTFYDGERAFLQLGNIDDVTITLNGHPLSGHVVLARVTADGTLVFLLEHPPDGPPMERGGRDDE